MKTQPITNCKLHCGAVVCVVSRSFLDRHVLSDTDALRNPQRQLTSDRYGSYGMIKGHPLQS